MRSDIAAWGDLWLPHRRRPGQGYGLLATLWLIFSFVGLRAALIYRLSYGLRARGVKALPGMLSRLNITLYGLDVPAAVPIGPRLYIPHPVGTVISAKRIGSDLTLVSGITIGMRGAQGDDFPTLGDHVYVGAGARILGAISIGDYARIGANAVVLTDVPAGASAVGVPARVRMPGTNGSAAEPVRQRSDQPEPA